MKHAAVVAGLALGLMSGTAKASVVIDINQAGNNVIATGSGSIDTFSLQLIGNSFNDQISLRGDQAFYSAGYGLDDTYGGLNGPSAIGPGGNFVNYTTTTGDIFAINESYGDIFLPTGYISGTKLTFSTTYAGQTIASLGLTAGRYTYTLDSAEEVDFRSFAVDPNTVTINIGVPSTVPLPASAPMFGVALIALGAAGYGLKRKSKVAAQA